MPFADIVGVTFKDSHFVKVLSGQSNISYDSHHK
jgi:hypothetical protein